MDLADTVPRLDKHERYIGKGAGLFSENKRLARGMVVRANTAALVYRGESSGTRRRAPSGIGAARSRRRLKVRLFSPASP